MDKNEAGSELEKKVIDVEIVELEDNSDLLPDKLDNKNLAVSMSNANSLDQKRNFAIQMIQSGLLPNTLASPDHLDDEDLRERAIGGVIAVVEYGRELKVTPWVALNNFHVVQGKVVIGINMYLGLALNNGIVTNVIEDHVKVYNKDKKLVDRRTTVEITRKMTELDGRVMTFKFSKVWTEIIKAGLADRDNYKKRPITMLRTRCITEALRLYAADIFMGIYETGEILDSNDNTYEIDEQGNVINR